MAAQDRRRAQFAEVRSFVGGVYGADLDAKRIDSLAGGKRSCGSTLRDAMKIGPPVVQQEGRQGDGIGVGI